MQNEHNSDQPWYKQFWPWVLISLPATIIVACGITIYLALVNPLNLVKKDYYKQGLTINKNFAQLKLAQDWGLIAQVIFNKRDSMIEVTLHADPKKSYSFDHLPDKLSLYFIHPLNSNRDLSYLVLRNKITPSVYRYQYEERELQDLIAANRWYVEITPDIQAINQDDIDKESSLLWTLKGEVHLQNGLNFSL